MHSGGMLAGWKFCNIKDGMFSEIIRVNEADTNLAFLPKKIPIEQGAMLSDMITTGFHGAELVDIKLGDTLCVIGICPVGLMSVAGANHLRTSRIFAVGLRKHCCEVAMEYGATDIIKYENGDIVEQVFKATNGKGIGRVVVAGGNVHTIS